MGGCRGGWEEGGWGGWEGDGRGKATFEGGCDEVGSGTSRGEHRRQLLDARGRPYMGPDGSGGWWVVVVVVAWWYRWPTWW